ncbi:hypothetical protein GCM10010116_50190 [Microbispora rosea subsp. aerata]|nr:hypothetical protein GCM10010116_50190 [Microbispora rosea subsp. aerata]GIH57971.1 hypothetical protein Mro02_48850 [Microbispora rosea subsp. aerata]GLJ81468.1 hypothetical protein GCM10017588_01920 [Microbispora rosea subsp. aerata]
MAGVPSPSTTLIDADVSEGLPSGKVSVGFFPTSPVTLMAEAAAWPLDEGLALVALFCAVPQAAASNKGSAATSAVRRRMWESSDRQRVRARLPEPAVRAA